MHTYTEENIMIRHPGSDLPEEISRDQVVPFYGAIKIVSPDGQVRVINSQSIMDIYYNPSNDGPMICFNDGSNLVVNTPHDRLMEAWTCSLRPAPH